MSWLATRNSPVHEKSPGSEASLPESEIVTLASERDFYLYAEQNLADT